MITKKKYRYLDNYKLNEKGEYVYTGSFYKPDLEEDAKNKLVRKILILDTVLFLTVIIGGSFPYKGMLGYFYIIFPYIIELLFVGLQFWPLYNIYKKYELKDYEYSRYVTRLKPYCMIAMISAVSGLLGCILNGITEGFEPLSGSLTFALTKIISIFLNNAVIRLIGQNRYSMIKETK